MYKNVLVSNKAEAKSKLEAKLKKLEEQIKELKYDLETLEERELVEEALLDIPYNQMNLKQRQALFDLGEDIFKWFSAVEVEEYTKRKIEPNREKTIRDYIDEGEPCGKIGLHNLGV